MAHTNGLNGSSNPLFAERFADLPTDIEVPVHDGVEEYVGLSLEELPADDTTELCTLLDNEQAARMYWVTIARAYAKQNQLDNAINVLQAGFESLANPERKKDAKGDTDDRVAYLSALCWMYLWKCREAPRLRIGRFWR